MKNKKSKKNKKVWVRVTTDVEVSQLVLVDASKPYEKEEARLRNKMMRLIKTIEDGSHIHFMDVEEGKVEWFGGEIDFSLDDGIFPPSGERGSPMWLAFDKKLRHSQSKKNGGKKK